MPYPAKFTLETLPLDKIIFYPELRVRVELSQEHIDRYAETYRDARESKSRCPIPPLKVFRDQEGNIIGADGEHRSLAAKIAGRVSLECEVYAGTKDDCFLAVVGRGPNSTHGKSYSHADIRHRIVMVLDHPTYGKLSQQAMAKQQNVAVNTLRAVVAERKQVAPITPQQVDVHQVDERAQEVGDSKPTDAKQEPAKAPKQEQPAKSKGGDGKSYPAKHPGKKGGIKAEAEEAKKNVEASIRADFDGIADVLHDRLVTMRPTQDEIRRLRTYEDAEQVNIVNLVNGKEVVRLIDAIKAYELVGVKTKDKAKQEIPDHLLKAINDTWYAESEKAIKGIAKDCLVRLQKTPYFIGGELAKFIDSLQDAARRIGDCQPSVVCPECKGDKKASKDCGWCRGSGFMPAWAYNDWKSKQPKG